MKSVKIVVLHSVLAMFLAVPTMAEAQTSFPATIAGTVMIDSEVAPDDTMVTAMVNDAKVGSDMVMDGKFAMLIAPDTADANRGMVSFMVGDMDATSSVEVMLAPGIEALGIILDTVDFQPQMVSDFTADNSVKIPGAVSGFRFSFVTAEDLVANQDTITVHFDKDFKGHGTSLSMNHVTVSARHSTDATTGDGDVRIMQTGAYNPSTDVTKDLLSTADPISHTPAGFTNSSVLGNVEYLIPVPDMNGSEDNAPGIAAGSTVTVTISPAAGITNATEGGNKGPLGVYTSEQQQLVYGSVLVVRGIALNDYDANRGKVLTVIGRGFQNGTTAAVYLVKTDRGCNFDLNNIPDGATELVAEPVASDDTFQATFTVTVPPFSPGFGNCIYAQDGNEPPFSAGPVEFELEGLLTISPTSAAVGDEVDITLEDWPNVAIPADAVTIANVVQEIVVGPTSVSNGSANFRIEINTATPPGIHEIRVSANGESDVKMITISGAYLEASPATAVPNQAITVTGWGFTVDGTINATNDGSMVTLGGDDEALTRSAGGFRNFNNGESVIVDSGGSWSATIIVPITTTTTLPGTHWLEVMDSGGRSGAVDITIPARTLTITPTEARPGETVTLTGTGFPATNTRTKEQNTPSIQVYYDNDLVGTSIPEADGNISLSFRVPLDAAIPSTNRVEARYMIPGAPSGAAPVKANTNHVVPGARINLSMNEGKPGDRLTITGDGFKAFASVEYVRIGGIEVTPAPRPATDRNGEFTATILVPDLPAGAHSVEVQVGGVTVHANFNILGAAGTAVRSFSPATVAPGGELTVKITATGYGIAGAVTETLPSGFTYVSSSLPSDSVNVQGRELRFTLIGETAFTYTVTAPGMEGDYSFSGVLRDSSLQDVPVGGAASVTVGEAVDVTIRYDLNGNGSIERSEVIKAINDYLFGTGSITKAEVIRLINAYLFG